MTWPEAIACGGGALAAYLLGAVPFGLLAGLLQGTDIREHGSGNIGATNAMRVLGKPVGILVHALDIGKGFVASFVLAGLFAGWSPELLPTFGIVCGCAAILGHVFPVYLKFQGGKGMATSLGVFLGLAWLPTAIAAALWLVVRQVTRYVSVASMTAVASIPVTMALVPDPLAGGARTWARAPLIGFGIVIALLVIARHKSNLRRLLAGTENRIGGESRDEGEERC
ncbi:MAG: glycerol-3-phosphate 1-O-acyltransferase PlsY [Planctomycetota bacterium]